MKAYFRLGLGVLLCLVVLNLAQAQSVSFSPPSVTFSSQALRTTSSPVLITVTNSDPTTSVNFSSAPQVSGEFQISVTSCGGSLPPNGSCFVEVEFAPLTAGAISGALSVFDNAPNSPQVASLVGTGLVPVTASVAGLSFPSTSIGATSAAKAVTLTNNTSGSVSMSGPIPSSEFVAVGNTCGTSISAKGHCSMRIAFAPQQTGTIEGSLEVLSATNLLLVNLVGTGSGTDNAPVSLFPTSLSFGPQATATSSNPQSVQIRNHTGVIISNLALAVSLNFVLQSSTCGSSLGPFGVCTVQIVSFPGSAHVTSFDGALTVSYSGTNSPQVVSLSGSAIPGIKLTPTTLGFPAQAIGTTSAVRKVTVKNTTSSGVSFFAPVATSGDFLESDNCGSGLGAGASCTIQLWFSPTEIGAVHGSLVLQDSASGSPQIADLSGTGLGLPKFAYVPNSQAGTISIYTVDPAHGVLRPNGYVFDGPAFSDPSSVALSPDQRFLYVPNNASGAVAAYAIDPGNGGLAPLSGSPFAAGPSPDTFVVIPGEKFAYAGNYGVSTVTGFSLNSSTGVLTPLPFAPFPCNGGPFAMVPHPSGKFLYVANQLTATIAAFSINRSTGALTELPGSPYAAGEVTALEQIALDPSGHFLFAANQGSGIFVFKINSTTGALTQITGSPFTDSAIAQGLAVDPFGKFLYVGNFNSSVSVFAFNGSSGVLSQISGSPFPAAGIIAWVSVDPSGQYVYAVDQQDNSILAYSRSASTGALQLLSNTPSLAATTRTQSTPSALVTTAGTTPVRYLPKFVYVANLGQGGGGPNSSLSAFSMDSSSGSLTAVSGSPYATGTGPQFVATDPAGRFVYVANDFSNNITAYSINQTTGVLSSIAGSPFATGNSLAAVAVDPSGRFAFACASAPGTSTSEIYVYSVNPGSGALSAIAGSPFSDGTPNCYWLAVDPSGRFVYTINGGGVSAYAINLNTGALSPVAGSPYVALDATALNVDSSGRFLYVTIAPSSVAAYAINPLTGALTVIPGSPFVAGSDPFDVVISGPAGYSAYAVNNIGNTVSGYTINPVTGALSAASGSPFVAGNLPNGAAMDPSLKFLLVANGGPCCSFAGNVSVYVANHGVLSPVTGSPFPAGMDSISVAVTGTIH